MNIVMDNYKVDEEATKAAVEKYLLQAREYKVIAYIPQEAVITASYSAVPRGYTGTTTDQTARIAGRNVDEQERRRRHVERAEQAIGRLGERQRKLIQIRYMDEDHVLDYDAAMDLGFSDRHYRRIKSAAIFRLAGMLGLLVLTED